MNTSSESTLFNVQHKNRCYCQNRNLCYCTGLENPSRCSKSRSSSHKFVKVRSDNGGKHLKSASQSSLATKYSCSSAKTMMTSSSGLGTSSILTGFGKCISSKPELTGRREDYERSQMEIGSLNENVHFRAWNTANGHLFYTGVPATVGLEHSEIFSNEKIAKLQEFRLQNADECLSSCSRYSMDKIDKQVHTSNDNEVKYTLNSRGLLKPIGASDEGRAAIVSSKSAVHDILRQCLRSSKEKDKIIRKALCQPENSLALRYQKTY